MIAAIMARYCTGNCRQRITDSADEIRDQCRDRCNGSRTTAANWKIDSRHTQESRN